MTTWISWRFSEERAAWTLAAAGRTLTPCSQKRNRPPSPPEEKAPKTTAETTQPEEAPAEAPESEEKKEDANAPEEKAPEAPTQPAAAPEKKPAAPKAAVKLPAAPANPFEAAMRQVEEKITEDLAGELLQKPPVFQFGGVTEEITNPKKTFEQLRKEKEEDFPELEDGKRVSWTMEYGKISKTIPKPKDSVIHAMKAEIEKSEGFRDMSCRTFCCPISSISPRPSRRSTTKTDGRSAVTTTSSGGSICGWCEYSCLWPQSCFLLCPAQARPAPKKDLRVPSGVAFRARLPAGKREPVADPLCSFFRVVFSYAYVRARRKDGDRHEQPESRKKLEQFHRESKS